MALLSFERRAYSHSIFDVCVRCSKQITRVYSEALVLTNIMICVSGANPSHLQSLGPHLQRIEFWDPMFTKAWARSLEVKMLTFFCGVQWGLEQDPHCNHGGKGHIHGLKWVAGPHPRKSPPWWRTLGCMSFQNWSFNPISSILNIESSALMILREFFSFIDCTLPFKCLLIIERFFHLKIVILESNLRRFLKTSSLIKQLLWMEYNSVFQMIFAN